MLLSNNQKRQDKDDGGSSLGETIWVYAVLSRRALGKCGFTSRTPQLSKHHSKVHQMNVLFSQFI